MNFFIRSKFLSDPKLQLPVAMVYYNLGDFVLLKHLYMANGKYFNRICVKGRNAVVGQTYSNESVAGKVRMLQK